MRNFLRACHAVHSWLGIIVMPLVFVIALTGYYLNHIEFFDDLLLNSKSREITISEPPSKITKDIVQSITQKIWPDEDLLEEKYIIYRDVRSLSLRKKSGIIIIPGPESGFFFVKNRFGESIYLLNGTLLNHEYDWRRIFKSIHANGWLGDRFGTWLADLVAIAMMVFSISGLIMWSAPRIRRKRRLASK